MNEQDNVRTMQEAYDAFSKGDLAAVFSLLAEDAEYVSIGPTSVIPWAGKHTGREQIEQFFAKLDSAIEFEAFEAQEYIAQGDKLAVVLYGKYRAKATGKQFETNPQHIVTFQNGKITRMILLDDTAMIASMLTE